MKIGPVGFEPKDALLMKGEKRENHGAISLRMQTYN